MWSDSVWNCMWRVVTIRKRREGWRGGGGAGGAKGPPCWVGGTKIHPKSLSDPPGSDGGHIGWLFRPQSVGLGRRRVTDSRAERAAVAREGTASDTSPALIKTPSKPPISINNQTRMPRTLVLRHWCLGEEKNDVGRCRFSPPLWLETSPADTWMEKQTVDDKPFTEERPKYLDDNQKVCPTKSSPDKKFPPTKTTVSDKYCYHHVAQTK